MDDREKIVILYDYYGELLSDKQKEYFEAYYFDNLSLAEIAENEDKSRNAIHKVIKNVVFKLYEYEDKLKLCQKEEKLKKIMMKIKDEAIRKEIEGLLWRKDYL